MADTSALPIACDITALTPEQRRRYDTLRQSITRLIEGVEPLLDGYALRFSPTTEVTCCWPSSSRWNDCAARSCVSPWSWSTASRFGWRSQAARASAISWPWNSGCRLPDKPERAAMARFNR